MRASFMSTERDDQDLEEANEVFWHTFISRIRSDGFARVPRVVVDVGSHRGGLLEHIAKLWAPCTLYGIEPIGALRNRALLRLRGQAREVHMLDPSDWRKIPDAFVDLIVSFESLHLIRDLDGLFDHFGRVLSNGGRAYVALGCHAENPVWPKWRAQLEANGHAVATHWPIEILRASAQRNLMPSVRPLMDAGWVTHDPRDEFSFETVDQMLAHHFTHKLVFRFEKR